MSKNKKGLIQKAAEKIDHVLHPDHEQPHGTASDAEESEAEGRDLEDQDESDLPDPKPAESSNKSSVDAGAASDMSAHPKFAKFKRGN